MRAEANSLFCKCALSGILPPSYGAPRAGAAFDIDANDVLDVSASDKTTSTSNCIIIANPKGRLSKKEIESMVNVDEAATVLYSQTEVARIVRLQSLHLYH